MDRRRAIDSGEESGTVDELCSRRSLRGLLRRLPQAFEGEGIEGLCRVHRENLRQRGLYRLMVGVVGTFVPMDSLLELGVELERLAGAHGIHDASKTVLNSVPISWRISLPAQGEEEIRASSVIFYGRHGSILTPLLLAAALDRSDVKSVAASYVASLGPNIAEFCFPVYSSAYVPVRRGGSRGIVPRVVGWAAATAGGTVSRETARLRNHESLRRAAEHVRAGGGVVIAPDAHDEREPWRPGLGVLVAALIDEPGVRPTYLVPWSIRGASVVGIFQRLSRNPLLRKLGALRFRRPIQVILGPPVPVERIAELAGDDPAMITAYLEHDYRQRGFHRQRREAEGP